MRTKQGMVLKIYIHEHRLTFDGEKRNSYTFIIQAIIIQSLFKLLIVNLKFLEFLNLPIKQMKI